MITNVNQKREMKEFVADWDGKGDEKQDSQRFWLRLIHLLGIDEPTNFIRFEQRVKLSHTSFIDVMIPATHVMIEQKSRKVDLNKPIRQSDGTVLTPMEQARRYAGALPYSERPRWIVTCNFRQFQVLDMERPNDEPQLIELKDLPNEFYRLNFMVDVKDSHITKEMEISKSAGDLVAKLYNALLPLYESAPIAKEQATEYLNKFIVRLVFCLYAEDAGLFGKRNMFHDYLADYPARHFAKAIKDLFTVLDQKPEERDPFLEADLAAFPYVNGSLFREQVPVPPMDETTRKLILDDACDFDWSKISPTIFGAIFESTLNPETRRHGGMHYTSIENIHKVIDPLFLNDYKQKFQQAMQLKTLSSRIKALKALQNELASGKYFDPACGSGNFLTESYLSLRRLENDILRETITDKAGTGVLGFAEEEYNPIKVSIQQFYGIEINDFAVSVAKTAIWIAESQMFQETEEIIHKDMDFLPLTTNANIHEGNALRMDWKEIVEPSDDVRIMGNPPFVANTGRVSAKEASSVGILSDEQKKDRLNLFGKDGGILDYVACWYKKAAIYMKDTKAQSAFVSTDSICQGQQVEPLWKPLFDDGIFINFAYTSFKWNSESTNTATVFVVIIGFSYLNEMCELYRGGIPEEVPHINGYLFAGNNFFITKRKKPISKSTLPMVNGGKPTEGGNLILSEKEKDELIREYPICRDWIRPYMMGQDFIARKPRYCLWLVNASPAMVRKVPPVLKRIQKVREYRENSKKLATRRKADIPMLFDEIRPCKKNYIAVPKVTSGARRYIPMDYLPNEVIPGDSLFMIADASLYDFGVLQSNVHMAWVRIVCSKFGPSYRYSNTLAYNNFPWPTPTPAQKAKIEQTAQGILDARAKYPDSSLADLYDETTMPPELRKAHRLNNIAVLQAYGFWHRIPNTESACVAELMKLYQQLTEKQK